MKYLLRLVATTLLGLGLSLNVYSASKTAAESEESQIEAAAIKAEPHELVQTIYYGGDIITMEGDTPDYVESLVEREGKIVFVGDKADAVERFGDKAREVDLKGHTLLPGFLDGHSHIVNVGAFRLIADILPPPDGPGKTFDDLIATTKAWAESKRGKAIVNKLGWIIANGYDDSQLAERVHPTADVLDKVSVDLPVIFIHQSGHLAVLNHKGLEVAGITKDTPDPDGGVIQRDSAGNPTGILEEQASLTPIYTAFAKFDGSMGMQALQMGQEVYAKNGYTTAQSGQTPKQFSDLLEAGANANKIFIDIVAYPNIRNNVQAVKPEFYSAEHRYNNGYRVGGVKLALDGSPQGKTAWLTHPYHVPPKGKSAAYHGYAKMSDEDAIKYVSLAFKNKWQILCHNNGDAAIDQYIKAIKVAQKDYNYDDHRTVVIHAQTIRKDQIPSLVALGIYPSFYSAHTYYWGDWHLSSVLGHPRADYISPGRDAIDAGLTMTSHHDAPVIPPKSMRVLDAPVNRVTRSGYVLGPEQRITVYEGLKSLTEWAAMQYFEEKTKGTLSKGKLADLVILEKNPLKIEALNIHDIAVLETIKEGETVYKR